MPSSRVFMETRSSWKHFQLATCDISRQGAVTTNSYPQTSLLTVLAERIFFTDVYHKNWKPEWCHLIRNIVSCATVTLGRPRHNQNYCDRVRWTCLSESDWSQSELDLNRMERLPPMRRPVQSKAVAATTCNWFWVWKNSACNLQFFPATWRLQSYLFSSHLLMMQHDASKD